jgi:pSer/pThr/pTyr-binding forkhead associated (FHA) protein
MGLAHMIENRRTQQIELEIVRGQAQQRRRPVCGPAFLIGTSTECDLVLGSAQLSEVYACLVARASGVTLRQVGEGPAILVNGRPVIDADLQDGDRLAAGPFEFVVHIVQLERTIASSALPFTSPSALRWRGAQQTGTPSAVRDAARLIHDIRAAFEERPAMRRPA